jgi:predicted amidohydrolase YtcJ
LLRDLPISLARVDVHAEWVSPRILELLGELPDEVEGGQIVRYPDGTPTGVFVDNAIDLLNAIRPPWTEVQMRTFLERVQRDGLSKGLTGIHNARLALDHARFFKRYEASTLTVLQM